MDWLISQFLLLLLSSLLLMITFCSSVPKSTAKMMSQAYRPSPEIRIFSSNGLGYMPHAQISKQ